MLYTITSKVYQTVQLKLFVEVPMDVRLGDEFADGLIACLCINHMYVK